MAAIRQLGNEGQAAANIIKNTERIESASEATIAAHDLHADAIGAIETAVGSGGKSWFALFRDK